MTACSALQQELSEAVCTHCTCMTVFVPISEPESFLWYKRSTTCMVFLGPIRDVLTTGKRDSLDGSKKYSYNDVH